MGLTAWDLGTDPYDHAQLANNFDLLDTHRHVPGEGLPIPSDGIANAAITAAKLAIDSVLPTSHIPVDSIPQSRLADDSVGSAELQDGAVLAAHIATGVITASKLDAAVLPIGSVIMWYRADSAVSPPSGWEVMDGRAWSTITNKLGAGGVQWNTGNIPNMANKFPLGAATAGTGSGPSTPPTIGGSGGLHERDLTHTHTTNGHTHTVDSHAHSISADGTHTHAFVGSAGNSAAYTRDVGVPKSEGSRQALYVPGHNANSSVGSDVVTPLATQANHSHTGATGNATAGTSSTTVTVNNGLTGNTDLRPAHIGLLFIMKVQ
jgi:hypothetical protein